MSPYTKAQLAQRERAKRWRDDYDPARTPQVRSPWLAQSTRRDVNVTHVGYHVANILIWICYGGLCFLAGWVAHGAFG